MCVHHLLVSGEQLGLLDISGEMCWPGKGRKGRVRAQLWGGKLSPASGAGGAPLLVQHVEEQAARWGVMLSCRCPVSW